MKTVFKLKKRDLEALNDQFKPGKNSDIGKYAIEIIKLYFTEKYKTEPEITLGKKNQPDIIITHEGVSTPYEIKGTEGNEDEKINFTKLKVSSKYCHDELKNGMEIIRVSNIRQQKITIRFLKYGVDFELKQEARWAVVAVKNY